MIIKDPATHQTRSYTLPRYTNPWNANIRKLAKFERNVLCNNKFKLNNLNLLTKFESQSIFKMFRGSKAGTEMPAPLVNDISCSNPAHTSIRCCIKSFTSCTFSEVALHYGKTHGQSQWERANFDHQWNQNPWFFWTWHPWLRPQDVSAPQYFAPVPKTSVQTFMILL